VVRALEHLLHRATGGLLRQWELLLGELLLLGHDRQCSSELHQAKDAKDELVQV
jgi:hypothetical protein